MVNVVQANVGTVTANVVVVLAAAAAFFTLLSVLILFNITHNSYTAGYYTISALFDAVGVDVSGALSAMVVPYSTMFYEVVLVSVLDGLVKIVIIGFVIAAVINIITTINTRLRLSGITRRRMKNHIIICGYTPLAERLASALAERKTPFVIIEKERAKADEAHEEGFAVLHEDFTTDAAFKNAMVDRARAVIFMLNDDYDNLLGVVTAHHINSKVRIISKAQDIGAVTKIHRAGADLCVVPEMLAGIELGEAMLSRR